MQHYEKYIVYLLRTNMTHVQQRKQYNNLTDVDVQNSSHMQVRCVGNPVKELSQ